MIIKIKNFTKVYFFKKLLKKKFIINQQPDWLKRKDYKENIKTISSFPPLVFPGLTKSPFFELSILGQSQVRESLLEFRDI